VAQYKTHVTFNMLLGYPLGAFLFFHYYSASHFLFALFSSSFLLSTMILNPDLDIANTFKLFSVRGMLTLPFRPYSYVFSHRGISHFPLIGTLTRLAYLALIFSIVFLCVYGQIPPKEYVITLYEKYAVPFWVVVVGIIYADLCHILLDGKKATT